MSDCTNPHLIRNLLDCFSAFLTTEIPPNKRPLATWKRSLRRDLTTATENTGRVFFERGGSQAWAAYEALRPTINHYQGQADRRHLFAQLDRQSLEVIAGLAIKIAAIDPHPTVANLIAPINMEARNVHGRPVGAQHSMLGANTPLKRRRTDECSLEPRSWPFWPPPAPRANRHETISPAAGAQTAVEAVSGARIKGLAELVPPYMMGAIRTYNMDGTSKDVEAAVTMFFPEKDLDMPCAIAFDIIDQKVEYLAGKLYNAHLEREGPARVMYYDGGARSARIGSGTQLMCCTVEAIPGFFGPLVAQGNEASPQRQEEKLCGRRLTKTVTMDFKQVGEGAVITLNLGRREGSQIYEKLYRK